MRTGLRRFVVSPNALKIKFYKWYNKTYFKFKGIRFGQGLTVYNKIYVTGPRGHITIGKNLHFTSGAGVNPICSNVCGCIHTANAAATIVIGDNVGISSACIWAQERISIGNHVNIGGKCLIIDTDVHQIDFMARRDSKNTRPSDKRTFVQSAPIVIGDDVWIGANCQILKGVTIGSRSVIGAGSIVTKSIPEDCIAAGDPCRVIRQIVSR